jgi:hypothetical protein
MNPHPSAFRSFTFSLLVVLVASQGHAQSAVASTSSPFEALAGAWTGGGSIKMLNGATEPIRCRVGYEISRSGTGVQQELRCASDSYKFELTGRVVAQDGQLSGNFTEVTRNVGGRVSGRADPGQIQALVEGSGFSAEVGVTTKGDRQSVSIVSRGTEISEVSISLRRARDARD